MNAKYEELMELGSVSEETRGNGTLPSENGEDKLE